MASSTSTNNARSSAPSRFDRFLARTYLRQPPRFRIVLAILLTLVFAGAMIWAFTTLFNNRHPAADLPGVYLVSRHDGWLNLAAFVVLLAGGFWIVFVLVQFWLSLAGKWDVWVVGKLKGDARSKRVRRRRDKEQSVKMLDRAAA
ncbi:hypothetical protein BDV95DRAFT_590357 [Massariosphaeria phaeospora]|uniref:Uncharacterized protein n=1 Tax=Massariosphaeria phaeospora TaxID=100035 RepID=A0A7C8MGT8_9PLEO|nr:hypothetical protein BDV95DRAFT_590357 [Massariosphaeria phaeospora]